MLVPKDMVVERLRARGDLDAVERAGRELGEKVDTEGDAELLESLGIDPARLEEELGGQSPAVG